MLYADLNEEQRKALSDASLNMRPIAGQFARLAHRIKLMKMGIGYMYVSGAVNALDDTELIPNPTGLAGATALPVAHWKALDALADQILALNTDANLTCCVEAAGQENCIVGGG